MSTPEQVIDRRAELKDLFWRQGTVETMSGYAALKTAPPAFQAQATEVARCLALAAVGPKAAELVVFKYASAEDCAKAVDEHNEALQRNTTSGQIDPFKDIEYDRRFFPMFTHENVRRPEAIAVAERLHRENPNWNASECMGRAKVIVTSNAKPEQHLKRQTSTSGYIETVGKATPKLDWED